MGSGMTLSVDDNLVKPVVEAEIQAAIVRQLENIDDLVPKLVRAVLREKVDSSGKVSSSDYRNSHNLLDVICRDAIQKAAKLSMKEYIKESADELRVEIKKQIEASSSELAKVFVGSLIQSLESKWSFTVKVNLPGQSE